MFDGPLPPEPTPPPPVVPSVQYPSPQRIYGIHPTRQAHRRTAPAQHYATQPQVYSTRPVAYQPRQPSYERPVSWEAPVRPRPAEPRTNVGSSLRIRRAGPQAPVLTSRGR